MNNEELLKRKRRWLKKLENEGKLLNPKEDHNRGLRALQNKTRRALLKFLGNNDITIDIIKNHFNLSEPQIKFHLSMLEQALFIEKTNIGWRLTPRGIGYLKNVELRGV